jgi:basic membrane lipoprotein Med (substrate-binding protein (PBP1-ABC) superfamily)
MTKNEMKAFLLHPGINISWFARQFYKGQKGAEKKFHAKLKGYGNQRFSFDEFIRLKSVLTEFANHNLDERY